MVVLENRFSGPTVRIAASISCVVMLVVVTPAVALAQDWRFEPVVRVGAEYDDNAILSIRTDEEIESSGLLLDLEANISYSSEITSFSVQPRVQVSKYPDNSEFDSDDYFLRTAYKREGQKHTFGFRGAFDEQLIRTAERNDTDLDVDDPDDFIGDDTGRIFLEGSRSKIRISPFWGYRLSDSSSIGVQVDHFDVQYSDIPLGLFTDYTDSQIDVAYRRKFSAVNTGLLTVTARKFDADTLDAIDGIGASMGMEHALSENTRLTAAIGVAQVRQSGFSNDTEAVGSIRLTRNLETIRMIAQIRRSIATTGAGRITARDSFNLNFRRRLNEKLTAGLGVRAYRSSGVGSFATNVDRNYVQLESSIRWYLSKSLIFETNYRYTVNDRSAIVGERADSNRINIWLIFQPKTLPKL